MTEEKKPGRHRVWGPHKDLSELAPQLADLEILNEEGYKRFASLLPGIRKELEKLWDIYDEEVRPKWREAFAATASWKKVAGPIEELETKIAKAAGDFISRAKVALEIETAGKVADALAEDNEPLAQAIANASEHRMVVPPVDGVKVQEIFDWYVEDYGAIPRKFKKTELNKELITYMVRLEGKGAEETLCGGIKVYKRTKVGLTGRWR